MKVNKKKKEIRKKKKPDTYWKGETAAKSYLSTSEESQKKRGLEEVGDIKRNGATSFNFTGSCIIRGRVYPA